MTVFGELLYTLWAHLYLFHPVCEDDKDSGLRWTGCQIREPRSRRLPFTTFKYPYMLTYPTAFAFSVVRRFTTHS